jgi:hypothetical protein
MLQPNDLPIVCLPLELPPAAAAELVAFLHELADALERHYGAQIQHHYEATARTPHTGAPDDPPF